MIGADGQTFAGDAGGSLSAARPAAEVLVDAGQQPGGSDSARLTGELTAAEIVEIEVKVAAEMAKRRMNAIEKRVKLREAFDMAWIASEERLMLNVINFSGEQTSRAYRVARQRAWWKAEHAWLKANPGDDLDAANIELHRKLATDELRHSTELAIAISQVETIEQDWDEAEAPSRTHKRLKEKLGEELESAGRWLTYALTAEQEALVARLVYDTQRTWRWRPRWRLARKIYGVDGVRVSLLDVRFFVRLSESFEMCLRNADAQRDVRELLACWGVEAKLVRDAEGTRFEGQGFTIYAI